MTKQSPKIVFFGSGPVAAESLNRLLAHTHVEAVITKPAAGHHRGSVPVIELAEQKKLPYFTPAGKAELAGLFEKEHFESSVGVVIDYGIIIPPEVINSFARGIVNAHFSLLPQWRGADPISFAILSGQTETGVSLMSITAGLDEGPLLAQDKIVIQPNDTSQSLTRKLIRLSDKMLVQYLPDYLEKSLEPYAQTGQPTYSRKLVKADGKVDWSKPAEVLEREIRAYHEWPKSTALVSNHELIIREADVVNTSGKPGECTLTKEELVVFCGSGGLNLKVVQPANRKEMPIQAFLAGYPL